MFVFSSDIELSTEGSLNRRRPLLEMYLDWRLFNLELVDEMCSADVQIDPQFKSSREKFKILFYMAFFEIKYIHFECKMI